MRTLVAVLTLVFTLGFLVHAAEKDTAAATATRKKLQVKISVEFKDKEFKEILADLKKEVEDSGAGSLSWTNDAGVSGNTKYSYSAKNKTVAEVLDGLLKTNSLGYIVVSKQGDRYDGWLKFKQGKERGYVAGEEPKDAKADAKAKSKDGDKAKDAEKPKDEKSTSDDKAETNASGKLVLAQDLLKSGKKDKAKQRFEEIVRDYPNTKAAGEAKKELEKLDK